ncbi:MAG TPA: hypothetical protein VHS05_19555 [Pyrinomonadaceae bacterium]|nr:hypothetical protein [Pyrinomonadaceae bacterium]
MRRTLLRIAMFLLAFGLGVGVSYCRQLYEWSQLLPAPGPEAVAVYDWAAPPQITIVGGMDACGPTANFHTVILSDGTGIACDCKTFSSHLAAAIALKTSLVDAEILERSNERDERGRVIGDRVLVTNPIQRFSLIGKNLCVTTAPSFHHLRLYESHSLYYAPRGISGNE